MFLHKIIMRSSVVSLLAGLFCILSAYTLAEPLTTLEQGFHSQKAITQQETDFYEWYSHLVTKVEEAQDAEAEALTALPELEKLESWLRMSIKQLAGSLDQDSHLSSIKRGKVQNLLKEQSARLKLVLSQQNEVIQNLERTSGVVRDLLSTRIASGRVGGGMKLADLKAISRQFAFKAESNMLWALKSAGQYEKLEKRTREIEHIPEYHQIVWHARAGAAMDQGDLRTAIQWFNALEKTYPQDQKARSMRQRLEAGYLQSFANKMQGDSEEVRAQLMKHLGDRGRVYNSGTGTLGEGLLSGWLVFWDRFTTGVGTSVAAMGGKPRALAEIAINDFDEAAITHMGMQLAALLRKRGVDFEEMRTADESKLSELIEAYVKPAELPDWERVVEMRFALNMAFQHKDVQSLMQNRMEPFDVETGENYFTRLRGDKKGSTVFDQNWRDIAGNLMSAKDALMMFGPNAVVSQGGKLAGVEYFRYSGPAAEYYHGAVTTRNVLEGLARVPRAIQALQGTRGGKWVAEGLNRIEQIKESGTFMQKAYATVGVFAGETAIQVGTPLMASVLVEEMGGSKESAKVVEELTNVVVSFGPFDLQVLGKLMQGNKPLQRAAKESVKQLENAAKQQSRMLSRVDEHAEDVAGILRKRMRSSSLDARTAQEIHVCAHKIDSRIQQLAALIKAGKSNMESAQELAQFSRLRGALRALADGSDKGLKLGRRFLKSQEETTAALRQASRLKQESAATLEQVVEDSSKGMRNLEPARPADISAKPDKSVSPEGDDLFEQARFREAMNAHEANRALRAAEGAMEDVRILDDKIAAAQRGRIYQRVLELEPSPVRRPAYTRPIDKKKLPEVIQLDELREVGTGANKARILEHNGEIYIVKALEDFDKPAVQRVRDEVIATNLVATAGEKPPAAMRAKGFMVRRKEVNGQMVEIGSVEEVVVYRYVDDSHKFIIDGKLASVDTPQELMAHRKELLEHRILSAWMGDGDRNAANFLTRNGNMIPIDWDRVRFENKVGAGSYLEQLETQVQGTAQAIVKPKPPAPGAGTFIPGNSPGTPGERLPGAFYWIMNEHEVVDEETFLKCVLRGIQDLPPSTDARPIYDPIQKVYATHTAAEAGEALERLAKRMTPARIRRAVVKGMKESMEDWTDAEVEAIVQTLTSRMNTLKKIIEKEKLTPKIFKAPPAPVPSQTLLKPRLDYNRLVAA